MKGKENNDIILLTTTRPRESPEPSLPPPPPLPSPPLLSLSLPLRWERGGVKIISIIVILFIRSGWFPAAYTEQVIAVSTG